MRLLTSFQHLALPREPEVPCLRLTSSGESKSPDRIMRRAP